MPMKHTDSTFAKIIKRCAWITGALTLLLAVWQHLFPSGIVLSLAITAGTVFYHFAMRLAVGAVIPALFRPRLNPGHRWFRQHAFERKLYRLLKLRRWKGNMPTYNPREFDLARNTLEEIIRNSCSAELVHEWIMLLSFVPVTAIPVFGAPGVFWITSALSALGDSVFVMMQRYNRPRLERLAQQKGGKAHVQS